MQVRYFHVNRHNKKVRQQSLTFAFILENNTLRAAVSVCSPKDPFVKKFGRNQALERLLTDQVVTTTVWPGRLRHSDIKSFFTGIACGIDSSKKTIVTSIPKGALAVG